MKRKSLIPAKRIKIERPEYSCVGCNQEIKSPGLSKRGKVLTGFQFVTREKETVVNLYPVQYGIIETRSKIPNYKAGLLCDHCASNYSHWPTSYTDKDGILRTTSHPMIMLDPTPGFNTTKVFETLKSLDTL